jgi:predicted MFS family arabinose efflux permease
MKNRSVETLSRSHIFLLALAVGVIAANLYYAQPLTAPIAKSLGLDVAIAGLVVTLTQIGYGVGVLFLVPLADLIENRRLILGLLVVAILALIAVASSTQIFAYFSAALFLGIGASAVQIIVPYAAHLSPEAKRGQVVGSLMSGLMLGIMLSRPIAGLLTDLFSWHVVFYLSATFMALLGIALYVFLPPRQPSNKNIRYLDLLQSMGSLVLKYSVLRRRAIYQGFMFAAFCLFWTATPLVLAGPQFHLSQTGIAIFALVGVGGAILAPIAGKMADRGWTRSASILAMVAGSVSFLLTQLVPLGSTVSLILLTVAAILLDGGVSSNLVLGQREIFSLPAEYRGRLNSLYIATIFVGGSFGSFIGAWAYSRGQWPLTAWIGLSLPLISLVFFLTERRIVCVDTLSQSSVSEP